MALWALLKRAFVLRGSLSSCRRYRAQATVTTLDIFADLDHSGFAEACKTTAANVRCFGESAESLADVRQAVPTSVRRFQVYKK